MDPFDEFMRQSQKSEEQQRQLEGKADEYAAFLRTHGWEEDPVDMSAVLALALFHGLPEEFELDVRKEVERFFLDFGLLVEPWTLLIQQEFEGEGLTDEERDAHMSLFSGRFAKRLAAEQSFLDRREVYNQFLVDHGVEVSFADEMLIVVLAGRKSMPASIGLRSYHEDALLLMMQAGRDCDAWRLLIDHEFLDWFDGS